MNNRPTDGTGDAFVAVSVFTVVNGRETAVRHAFQNRPREVEKASGFLRLEVLQPENEPETFHLVTWWRDAASFERWHGSDAHKAAHRGIPAGLRLDPAKTRLQRYERVAT